MKRPHETTPFPLLFHLLAVIFYYLRIVEKGLETVNTLNFSCYRRIHINFSYITENFILNFRLYTKNLHTPPVMKRRNTNDFLCDLCG
jgi:hypothetical protein